MVSPAVGKVIMVPFPFSDLHLHCPIRGSHTSRQKPSGHMRHPRHHISLSAHLLTNVADLFVC
jgi:hypothetical protein